MTEQDPHGAPPAAPRSGARKLMTGVLVALLAGGAWIAFDGPGTDKAVELVPSLGKFAGISRGDRKPAEGKSASAGQPGAPAAAQQGGPPRRPPVSVLAAKVERKVMAVRFDGLGTVTPIAQVVLRSRADSQIETVHVQDGARVKEGEPLFTLDSRQTVAQIKQAEAALARDKATLEGAQRDVNRTAELVARDASSRKLLDDARTRAAELTALVKSDEANIENLKVQLSYTQIKAPISGRFGVASLKTGAVARQGEATSQLGTIVQIAPIYVAFGVPQRLIGELRLALTSGNPAVVISGAGIGADVPGKVAFLDNMVDQANGMIMARAIIDNNDEALWPGALVNVRLSIRDEEQTVVPSTGVLAGQNGNYAFVIKDNIAKYRPIEVIRTQDGLSLIAKGLEPGEMVATDGQLSLVDGAPVIVRNAAQTKPGS